MGHKKSVATRPVLVASGRGPTSELCHNLANRRQTSVPARWWPAVDDSLPKKCRAAYQDAVFQKRAQFWDGLHAQ